MAFPNPVQGYRIMYSDSYQKQKDDEYVIWRKQINQKEAHIVTWPEYRDDLHEPMKGKEWKGYRHARISGLLRIMYIVDDSERSICLMNISPHKY